MKKFLLFFLSILSLLFILPTQSFAQNTTDTSYDVTYSVYPSGTTHTIFSVALKNNTSDYYVSSYSVQIGFTDIENVQAFDSGGIITPIVKKNENGYLITLHFNKQIVGLHTVLKFTLVFDTPDVAQKTGQIWELNIPGIGKEGNFSDFNVTVHAPSS